MLTVLWFHPLFPDSGIGFYPVNSLWGYYKQLLRNGLAEWL